MKGATISTLVGLGLLATALVVAGTGLAGSKRDAVSDQFAAIDRDGDGFVTPAEARAASAGLATHFDKFDRDRDGALSLGEFRRHSQPFSNEG